MDIQAKDLTKEAPRSPKVRIGGYDIIARTIDKCRATIAGTNGEYHFDCPLDKMLFTFKGIVGEDFKAFVAEGHTDEEIAEWLTSHGTPKTSEEITTWSDHFATDFSYSTDPEKSEWFKGECTRLNIDPATTTLFDYLDIDDTASFAK